MVGVFVSIRRRGTRAMEARGEDQRMGVCMVNSGCAQGAMGRNRGKEEKNTVEVVG